MKMLGDVAGLRVDYGRGMTGGDGESHVSGGYSLPRQTQKE
jgi:hypothetical protein